MQVCSALRSANVTKKLNLYPFSLYEGFAGEESRKDTTASITSVIKRSLSTEAEDQSQLSTSKNAGISYPPVLTALRRRPNK
ncbi:hypothetical protein M514_04411 [Trichuris suis]|uniref:Uncharacterized protein n=1 Tax=Trichuris suis TaxID=68888 RepID=A0A085MBW5_9BILA|nr:hypothetical protein M513_04411 [Trichuris suis]KFD62511.1 hypothetical protein M514_04411 [Trichuris suis]